MKNNIDFLKELTHKIILEKQDYAKLFETTEELFQLFNTASGCRYDDDTLREHIYLPEGKAIGTCWAAYCVKEIFRTQKFLQGIYKAILSAQMKFPGETLQILYAGTGPFATLAIPFTTLFRPDEIQFTLLEINPSSFQMLNNTIQYFNCNDYICSMELCNAIQYRPNPDKKFHIILSETMLQALIKEPQVSITLNLLPLLTTNGILIPEDVHVECVIMNSKKNRERMTAPDFNDKYFINLGTAFELDKNIHSETSFDNFMHTQQFPIRYFQIPDPLEPGYNRAYLMTEIHIYDDILLTDSQCSLTLPYNLKFTDDKLLPGKRFGLQYAISEVPHYNYIPVE